MSARKQYWMKQYQYEKANDLWWKEDYEQNEIADKYKCSQPHISYIVNNKRKSYQVNLVKKLDKLQETIQKYKPIERNIQNAKLTQYKVSRIRDLYFFSHSTQIELAKKFKVSQSTISKIIAGQHWKKKF